MKIKILLSAFLALSVVAYAGDGSVSEKNVKNSKMSICTYSKVKKTETVPLSHLVENCTIIRFETRDEAYFKSWYTTVTDKYIGIRQSGKPFKLFDRSGKFLCDVGSIGKGPGEYSISLYDEVIDDSNGLIYLAPFLGDKILTYNTSGKFIKNITAPQQLHKPRVYLSEKGTLTVVHMAFHGEKSIAFQFDTNGKLISELPPPPHLLVRDYNGEIFNTKNTSQYEFLHTSSDTLYHYDPVSNRILPVFTLDMSAADKQFKQYFELKSYYMVSIWGKEKSQIIAVDKKNQTSSFIRIVNDYYGNLEMPVSVVTLRNGWFVYNLESAELMEQIEKRMAESSCTAQDRKKLQELLSTLDENANNVLFLGKLK